MTSGPPHEGQAGPVDLAGRDDPARNPVGRPGPGDRDRGQGIAVQEDGSRPVRGSIGRRAFRLPHNDPAGVRPAGSFRWYTGGEKPPRWQRDRVWRWVRPLADP
jgi:hypothetical protein